MICPSRKRIYLFKSDAEKALRRLASTPGCYVKRCYQCRHCSMWHLTKLA